MNNQTVISGVGISVVTGSCGVAVGLRVGKSVGELVVGSAVGATTGDKAAYTAIKFNMYWKVRKLAEKLKDELNLQAFV